jgi:hypothetical protein
MPEIEAARQLDAERPVEAGLLGRVPGWVWLAMVGALVVFFAFFVTPQPPAPRTPPEGARPH